MAGETDNTDVRPVAAEAGRTVAAAQGPGRALAGRFVTEWRFWRNVLYDARRFRRHAWLHRVRSGRSREARILADAHFLEYGIALKSARQGFGFVRAERLAEDLEESGISDEVRDIGLHTLGAWCAFNENRVPDRVLQALEKLHRPQVTLPDAVETLSAEDVRAAAKIDFARFARARHSVRSFAPEAASQEAIRRAAAAAQEAPSSCNRQTCRVHVWTERDMIERVRRHQAGNRTFGHELGGIAVVTSDLRYWEHPGERYQAWIDGGLFAMTFVYALHAEGLGTCMLNWSVDSGTDRALRAEIGLGDEHLVIVLVGFGILPDTFKVCASPRLPTESALILNAPLASND
jgi:nitroreductase